jgi:WD40 repeat protein
MTSRLRLAAARYEKLSRHRIVISVLLAGFVVSTYGNPQACKASESAEFDFAKLAADLRDRGYEAVIAELRSASAHHVNLRLAAALEFARPFAENAPDQLWFQLQCRARQEGWTDIEAQLQKSRPVETLALISDGRRSTPLAVAASWKVSDAPITHIAYSSSQAQLYFGTARGEIRVVDAKTFAVVQRATYPGVVVGTVKGPVNDVVVLAERSTRRLRVIDMKTGKELVNVRCKPGAIEFGEGPAPMGMLTTPDGDILLIQEETDNLVQRSLVDPTQASQRFPLPMRQGFNDVVLMAPDAKRANLWIADAGGRVMKFSYPGMKLQGEPIETVRGSVTAQVVNSNVSRLATSVELFINQVDSGALGCIDLATGKSLFEFRVDERLYATTFLSDGTTLATGGNGTIYIVSPPNDGATSASGEPAASSKIVKLPKGFTTRLLTAADGKRVFVGTRDGYVRLVDLDPQEGSFAFADSEPGAFQPAVSLDGRWEATFGGGKVTIRDYASQKVVHELKLPGRVARSLGELSSVALLPETPAVVLAGAQAIAHWDLKSGETRTVDIDASEFRKTLETGQQSPKLSLQISPDGKRAVAVDRASFAIYDSQTGKQIAVVTPDVRQLDPSEMFLPGDRIAFRFQASRRPDVTNQSDGVKIFDLASGNEVANLQGPHEMRSVVFARKTGTIVTLGKLKHRDMANDRKIATWEAGATTPDIYVPPQGTEWLIGISDDGRRLLTVQNKKPNGGRITVFDWPQRKAIRHFDFETGLHTSGFDGRVINCGRMGEAKERIYFQYHAAK